MGNLWWPEARLHPPSDSLFFLGVWRVSAGLGLNGGPPAVRAWACLGGGKTPLVLWDTRSLLTVLDEEEGSGVGRAELGSWGMGRKGQWCPGSGRLLGWGWAEMYTHRLANLKTDTHPTLRLTDA